MFNAHPSMLQVRFTGTGKGNTPVNKEDVPTEGKPEQGVLPETKDTGPKVATGGSGFTPPKVIPHKPVVPAGFERFFQKEFLQRQPPSCKNGDESVFESQQRAATPAPEEVVLWYHQLNARRRRRMIVLAFCCGAFVAGRVLFGGYGAAPGDLAALEYVRVVMDLPSHAAYFVDENGKQVGMGQFIDPKAFYAEMVANGKDVLVTVHSYFPLVPLLMLCVLPAITLLHGAFTMSARMSAKEAVRGSVGALEKPRFRFKKESGLTTRLADVAGLTEAKHEVTEVIDFLKNPDRFVELGAKLPKGVLLDGPPGTGKTLLAKAVAGEANVNFVSCSGSEFDEVFVGVGAKRVRELFKEARASRPCVIFVDEIDAFGRQRSTDGGGSTRSTLNAFLSELDGFHEASGIIVLAATNRADVLDNALTRSGRFDRKITIDLPPHKDRVAIAKVHLAPLKLSGGASALDSFAESLASLTPGCSGADIFNICNEAAIIAAREDKEAVDLRCFQQAIDRVRVGLERKATKLSEHERTRLAFHEAGHVVLSWMQKFTDPVIKTSIAPRGTRIAHTQKLPHEVFISTQERLRQNMIARLGGFVAEELFFQDISSEAAEDLKAVTDSAMREVCEYGMDKEVGHVGYEFKDNAVQKPFGPKREDIIDNRVANVVEICASRARELVKLYEEQIKIVAGSLLKQETLTAQELWLLLGDRPEMSKEFVTYLQS